MFKYFQKIQKEIKQLDSVAKNPFLQENHSYNPCQNCLWQTYVWIEEDKTKPNIFNSKSKKPFCK